MLKFRKAQSEQFNWVFIVFAGAVILVFFTVFLFKYTDLENKKTNIEILRTIDGNIEVLESSGEDLYCDTSVSKDCLSLGLKAKLKFTCFNDRSVIDVNNEKLDLKDEIVFMPTNLYTKDLGFWIKSLNYPYFISNILYITNSERKFYFVYDNLENEEFIESLQIPDIFNYEVVSLNDFKSQEGVVVFFTNSMPNYNKGLYVNKRINEVTFLKEKNKINYINEQLLIGAFFVDDFNTYQCALERAKKRLNLVSQVYYYKSKILAGIEVNPGCLYSETESTLNKFAQGSFDLKPKLEEQNNYLVGGGCKPVF